MKWTTITSFVDLETGEAITAAHVEKGKYLKVKLITTYKKKNNDYGTRYNKWLCDRNRQTEIQF